MRHSHSALAAILKSVLKLAASDFSLASLRSKSPGIAVLERVSVLVICLILVSTTSIQVRPALANASSRLGESSAHVDMPTTQLVESPIPVTAPVPTDYGQTSPDDQAQASEGAPPVKPRTVRDKVRVEALSYYMAGTLHLARNNEQQAYASFQKAVELSPESVEIYQALIPLAFSLNKAEEGLEYALKAVELDPNDHQLLRALGVHMARDSQVHDAIKFLEKAVASNRLNHATTIYVRLNRDLAILYQVTSQTEKAADAFEIVFQALENPDKFGLDLQTRASILADERSNYQHIGEAFLAANRTELALKAFEQARTQRQGRPGNLDYHLAEVYLQTGQAEKALAAIQVYFDAQLQSKGQEAYELLKRILIEMGQSDELIPRLKQMAEADSRNETLQIYLGDEYLALDRLDEAESQYKKILESSSEIRCHIGLVTVYRKKDDVAKLLTAITSALSDAKTPSDLETALQAFDEEFTAIAQEQSLFDRIFADAAQILASSDDAANKSLTNLTLGQLSLEADKSEDAVQYFQASQQTDNLAVLYVSHELLGNIFTDEKRYSDAVDTYQSAVTSIRQEALTKPYLQRYHFNFLYLLSRAQELNGQTEEALKTVREAQQKVPEAALLFYHEGWIYLHSHNWDKAISTFEKVIERFPQSTDIIRTCQFSISNIYVQKGEIRKGEEILEKILAENPDDPSVNNDLGYLYADQGKNLEQAEAMIRKAIAADPDNAAYLDSMGWVLFKLKKFEEAAENLEKAIQQPSGGDATIYSHLGDCYHELGKKEQALEAWNKALSEAKSQTPVDDKKVQEIEDKIKTSTAQ